MFDLLAIPILGREEDAADDVAAHVILKLDPPRARKVVDEATYFMASYAKTEHPTKADLSTSTRFSHSYSSV